MELKSHADLIADGYTFLARRAVQFSNNERRLYEKRGDPTAPYFVVVVAGTRTIQTTEYSHEEYPEAYMHMQHGRT